MALNANKVANNAGPKAPALDPDNYMARVVQVIDLGVQNQRPFQGKEKPPAHEIMLTYELVTEFMPGEDGEPDEDKPRWVSERFPLHNMKADRAKSTKRYLAIDPKQKFKGDFAALVGQACLVTIVNNERDGRVYNNVGGISQPLKGIPVPELKNEPVVFDLDDPDLDVFLALPEWIQNIIKEGLEYPKSKLAVMLEGGNAEVPEEPEEEDDFPV